MERLPMEQYDESIKSDWNKILSESDFLDYLEESLEIRDYEKKARNVDGKRVKGVQMTALRKAIETGKNTKGAVYFLMRAVHNWKQRYYYEVKFKPHSHIKDDETVSRKLHKGVMTQMELEIEELVEQLEGHNTMSLSVHKEMVEELNDKIYELEKEIKKLKSDKEKDNESLENYYKKKSDSDCAMLQKKIDWLTSEIHKIGNKTLANKK